MKEDDEVAIEGITITSDKRKFMFDDEQDEQEIMLNPKRLHT